jgi:hypothetical protein
LKEEEEEDEREGRHFSIDEIRHQRTMFYIISKKRISKSKCRVNNKRKKKMMMKC